MNSVHDFIQSIYVWRARFWSEMFENIIIMKKNMI